MLVVLSFLNRFSSLIDLVVDYVTNKIDNVPYR
jgi:hypothetical protein